MGSKTCALTISTCPVFPVETFILFTAVTLQEDDMAVHTSAYLPSIPLLLALLPFINDPLAVMFALSRHLIGHSFADPRRLPDSVFRLPSLEASYLALIRFNQPALLPLSGLPLPPNPFGHHPPGMSPLA